MSQSSRLPWFALAASAFIALYCLWMSAQIADLTFVQCHGDYALGHAIPACRRAVVYGYGTYAGLFAALFAAGVLVVKRAGKAR